jgi:hypothetical protein
MQRIQISQKWTLDERLSVILRIAHQLAEVAQVTHNEPLFREVERIALLTIKSPKFLEANRIQMLDGLEFTN